MKVMCLDIAIKAMDIIRLLPLPWKFELKLAMVQLRMTGTILRIRMNEFSKIYGV